MIWALFGMAGTLMLVWPLYNSIWPVPTFPNNVWPYVVVAWVLAGVLLSAMHPARLVAALSGPAAPSD